jgi:hypothetical protein
MDDGIDTVSIQESHVGWNSLSFKSMGWCRIAHAHGDARLSQLPTHSVHLRRHFRLDHRQPWARRAAHEGTPHFREAGVYTREKGIRRV